MFLNFSIETHLIAKIYLHRNIYTINNSIDISRNALSDIIVSLFLYYRSTKANIRRLVDVGFSVLRYGFER